MAKEGATQKRSLLKLKMFFPALHFGHSKCSGPGGHYRAERMSLPYVLQTRGSQGLRLRSDLLKFLQLTNGRPGMKIQTC